MDSKLTDFLGVIHMSQKNVDLWKKIETENYSFFTLRFSTEKRGKTVGSYLLHFLFLDLSSPSTVPIAKIISVKNARAWVSMVSYLKK